ncbi:MAG: hypothetical protein QNJ98_00630 [Planctomycetota bacterium]|nr:hypothetical protein [Planctomycetota bacterium]
MGALDKLVATVLDDADRACLAEEDRALGEARKIELAAEDRLAELEGAARDLGRARGMAVDRAREAEADREIDGIHAGAADQLWSRFRRHLLLALDGLPGTDGYGDALAAWAAHAARRIDRPVEVFAARRDRTAVYEALLDAGARDFQVQVERRHTVGFVVRDLDGRTVYDCRPEALLEGQEEALQALVASRVPPYAAPEAPPT